MLIIYALAALVVLLLLVAVATRFLSHDNRVIRFSSKYGVEAASQKFALPIKTVRRLRVLKKVERKSCATCVHFDLAKGQEAIQAHQIIAQVTRALPPATISKDKDNAQAWSDFGACGARTGIIMGADDWCGREVHAKRYTDGDRWA